MLQSSTNYAGTGGTSARSGSVGNWTSASSITGAPDSSGPSPPIFGSMTAGNYSGYLNMTNFGFVIPPTAIIRGVTLETNIIHTDSDRVRDSILQMIIGGSRSGSNLASASDWPSTLTYVSHGGSTNLWGNTLTPAIVNSSAFGFALSIYAVDTGSYTTPFIDNVRATVYYDLPDPTGHF